MQTTRYPLWKSVAWVLGILAYGLGATVLSAPRVLLRLLSYLFQMSPSLGHVLNSLPLGAINGLWLGLLVGLWVGLPAVAVWQVTVRGNKTARLALAVMAAFVVVLCVFLGSGGFTGKWWLGWIGVPDPLPIRYICDGPISGPGWDSCAHDSATMTAEAPHPPEWLPWGH